jgi:WD40 repeat protein
MSREPSERYSSARALADDVARWMADEPVAAWREPWDKRWTRWARRHRAWVGSGMVSLLLISLVAVIAAIRIDDAYRKERVARQHEAEQRRRAQWNSARVLLNQGLAACDAGEVARGMLWLARSLEATPLEDQASLGRIIRSNLGGWSRELRPLRVLFAHPNTTEDVFAAQISPDGQTVLTGCLDGTARLWRADDGTPVGPSLRHEGRVLAVAFSPDGRMALTGGADQTARLRDAATGRPLGEPIQHPSAVRAVAFAADGTNLLTAGADRQLRVWAVASGTLSGRTSFRKDLDLYAAAFGPGAGTLITGDSDGAARLWDVVTGRELGKLTPHEAQITAVGISPDGRTAVTGDLHGVARLWDMGSHQRIGAPLVHRDVVWGAAFSPDGRTVMTGSTDRTARLWDASTGEPIGPPLRTQIPLRTVAFGPDGATLLAGGQGGQTRLWGPSGERRPKLALPHGGNWITTLAISPDGRTLLTAGGSPIPFLPGYVWLWDTATGRSKAKPLPYVHAVLAAAFSPDGTKLLASWGHPGPDPKKRRQRAHCRLT